MTSPFSWSISVVIAAISASVRSEHPLNRETCPSVSLTCSVLSMLKLLRITTITCVFLCALSFWTFLIQGENVSLGRGYLRLRRPCPSHCLPPAELVPTFDPLARTRDEPVCCPLPRRALSSIKEADFLPYKFST